MSLMTRPVAGESLRTHVGARLDGAPVASAGSLLARLGLGNPWSGSETVDPRAQARANREARLEARLHRFDRSPIRASRRMWPGESRSAAAWAFGGYRLSESAMVFPLMPLEEEPEEEVVEQGGRRRRGPRGPSMRPVSNPWHSVEHAPARVIRGGGRRTPAARTARVSKGGRVRFEPAPRRARQSAPTASTTVAAPQVITREAPVVTASSPADRRAADLVRESRPSRSVARRSAPSVSVARPAGFMARPVTRTQRSEGVTTTSRSAAGASVVRTQAGGAVSRSQGVRTRASDAVARRRPMQRLGDRVAAVLGPVSAPAAIAAGTERSQAVRTASGTTAQTAAVSTGSAAPVSRSAAVRTAAGSTERSATVRTASAAGATTVARTGSESTSQQVSRRRLARARAATERAVLGPALARAASPVLARHLHDGDVRPLEIATGRTASKRERRRGLRPVFRHSPMMAVVEPELAEEPQVEAEVAPARTRRAAERVSEGPRTVRGFGSRRELSRSTPVRTASRSTDASVPATATVATTPAVSRAAEVAGAAAPALSAATPASARPAAGSLPDSTTRVSRTVARGTEVSTSVVRTGVSRAIERSAPVQRRTAGTGWVARRLDVGTASEGAFRPSVMTRRPVARAASPAPATPTAPGTTAVTQAVVSRAAPTPAAPAPADAPVAAAPMAAIEVPTEPARRTGHASSVFRRMETGTVAPGSTLPVAVPRRVRTGKGRSLFLSVPDAVVPQAAPEAEPAVEEAPQPRRRATESPRVIRSASRTVRAAGEAAVPARSQAVRTAPSASTPARTASKASTPAASTTRTAARAPSVMDFGTVPTATRSSAARTATRSQTPAERVAARATEAVERSAAVRTAASNTVRSSAVSGRSEAAVSTARSTTTSSGSVSRSSVAGRVSSGAASGPSASSATVVRTAAGTAVSRSTRRPMAASHRAIEVAASRSRPLERFRSVIPRRPRLAGERTAERPSFSPSMADGRPVVSAATRMTPKVRRASGTRVADDAALVQAPEPEASTDTPVDTATRAPKASASPRVVRAATRTERLAAQASQQGSTGHPASEPSVAPAVRTSSVVARAASGSPVAHEATASVSSPTGSTAPATRLAGDTAAAPTVASSPVQRAAQRAAASVQPTASRAAAAPETVAFARSARALAKSAATPARVSSVLHAAARAALDGQPDTVERLLRVADVAAKREETARSLMPKVSPRHGARAPSMWSNLRSPIDSAVALAHEPEAAVEEAPAASPARSSAGRTASSVPVIRGARAAASASTARVASRSSKAVSSSVQAARRHTRAPVTTDTARSVLRTAPPKVRARVKALLSRRSRPSALGYARLADVDQVLEAVTQAFTEVGASSGSAPNVQVVRDTSGRRKLANARQASSVPTGSRPAAWAGARTAAAVTDPDPRIRRAVSAMSVFRTAFGEMSLPAGEVPAGVDAVANDSGARRGRHVLRTADGRFVSPTSPAAAAPLSRSRARAEADSVTRTARSAYGVDTDTLVNEPVEAGEPVVDANGVPVVRGSASRAAVSRTAAIGSTRTDMVHAASPAASRSATKGQAAPRTSGAYRNRPRLHATLGEVDEHSGVRHELPVWARRASGTPLVRSSEQREVFQALARAHTPEQVVQVIAHHGSELGAAPASLPAPVLQVIEQVREGARQDLEARFKAAREAANDAESTGARSAPTPAKAAKSAEPELLRAARGLRKSRNARRKSGQGDDRVMKLARKLQSLIHLAEGTGDQNEARRHVRMAENSEAARREGQGQVGAEAGASNKNQQVDIEALVSEVVQSVNSELAMRRQRRQEDPDGGNWW